MNKRHLSPLCTFVFLALFCLGCSSQTSTLPNPFTTADRVPPPPLRSVAPGTAQPYYPAAPLNQAPLNQAPAFNSGAPQAVAPANPAAPAAPWPQTSGYPATNPYPATTPYPAAAPNTQPYSPSFQPQATPVYPGATPGPGPLGSNQSSSSSRVASAPRNSLPGDNVAIPNDAGSLRFASPTAIADARAQAAAASDQPLLASRPATANSWIAGSGPVRRPAEGANPASPRVRVPGANFNREPVSIAALDRPQPRGGSVAIAPLEPAPFNGEAAPGERAPLRVATPSTTGWR